MYPAWQGVPRAKHLSPVHAPSEPGGDGALSGNVQQKVDFDRVSRFVSKDVASRLRQVFGQRPLAVWGSRDSPANRAKFEKMAEGDDLLIVEGDTIKLMGKVALRTVNADLSRELWHNIIDSTRPSGWDLIYFIANPVEIGVPFAAFCNLLEYEPNYQLRGFTIVGAEKLERFYKRYDDLYSVLVRVASGQAVVQKSPFLIEEPVLHPFRIEPEDVAQVLRSPIVSDHVKMQWKLAMLGLKAGEKIWVPVADQRRAPRGL